MSIGAAGRIGLAVTLLATAAASLACQHTSSDGGAALGGRPDEKAVYLRLQQTFERSGNCHLGVTGGRPTR